MGRRIPRKALRALTAALVVSCVALPGPLDAATKPKVTIAIKPSTMKAGQTAHATGKVTPAAPGKSVQLQKKSSGAWKSYGKPKKLGKASTFDFAIAPTACGIQTFRVKFATVTSPAAKLTINPKNPAEICVDGPVKTAKTTQSDQNVALVFKGKQNQLVQITLSGVTWHGGGGGADVIVRVIDPGNVEIRNGYAQSGEPDLTMKFDEEDPLPATGTYRIELDPVGLGTGQGVVRIQSL